MTALTVTCGVVLSVTAAVVALLRGVARVLSDGETDTELWEEQ